MLSKLAVWLNYFAMFPYILFLYKFDKVSNILFVSLMNLSKLKSKTELKAIEKDNKRKEPRPQMLGLGH